MMTKSQHSRKIRDQYHTLMEIQCMLWWIPCVLTSTLNPPLRTTKKDVGYERENVDIMLALDGVFTTGYRILNDGRIQLVTIKDKGVQLPVDKYLPNHWKHGDIVTFRELVRAYRNTMTTHRAKVRTVEDAKALYRKNLKSGRQKLK